MPDYQYIAADILTGEPLQDLPLYGTYYDRNLSAAGQMTGSVMLTSGNDNGEITDSTIPGRSMIHCLRDGTYLNSYIVQSRTYNSTDKVLQINGLDMLAAPTYVVVDKAYSAVQKDQIQVFKDLWDAMQLQQNDNFNVDTSGLLGQLSSVLINLGVQPYDYVTFDSLMQSMIEAVNSFDYTIDVIDVGRPGRPIFSLRVGSPQLIPPGVGNNLDFDYPGNVDSYYVTDSASAAGTTVVGIGAGSGSSMLQSVQVNQQALDNGFPNLWQIDSRKDITDQGTLDSVTQQKAQQLAPPVTVPVITLKADKIPPFEDWSSLGANFNVHILDERFPHGVDLSSRMIGWQLYPSGSDQVETVKFVIEGGDLSDG
jgi:hypothetical protein